MKLTYALGLSACAVAYAVPIDRWHHEQPANEHLPQFHHGNIDSVGEKRDPAPAQDPDIPTFHRVPSKNPDGPGEKRDPAPAQDPDIPTFHRVPSKNPDGPGEKRAITVPPTEFSGGEHDDTNNKRDSPATDDSTNTLTVDTKPLIAGDDATYRLPLSELGKLGIIEVKPGSNIFGNRKPGITVDGDNTNPLNSGEDPLIAADGTNKPLADGLPDADKLKSIIDDTTKPPSKRDDPPTDDNVKSEDEDPLHPKNPIPLKDVLDDDETGPIGEVHFGEGAPSPRIGVPIEPPAKRDDPLTTTTINLDTLKAGGDPLIAADGTNQKLPDGDDDELRKLGIIAVPDEPKDKGDDGDDGDEGDENDPFHGFPHDFVLENKRPPIDTFPYSDQPVSNN